MSLRGKRKESGKLGCDVVIKKRFSIVLITETKRTVIHFFYEFHLASIGDANQIIFAQKNNQRLGAANKIVFEYSFECFLNIRVNTC